MTLTERIGTQPILLRRALALLLLAAAALSTLFGLIYPIRYVVASQDSWRAEARAVLARDRGMAATGPQVRAELSALKSAPIWQRFYVRDGASDPAQLIREDVTSLCTAAGATIQSATPLAAVDEAGLVSRGVRVTASMSVDQLKSLIVKMRAHPRYLRVRRLRVLAPQSQTADTNPALTVALDIQGYSRL